MNNDIVTKARLNAALGTEGNMGFEHNDIVTVDVMNKAIEEGGGGGGADGIKTAKVTLIVNAGTGGALLNGDVQGMPDGSVFLSEYGVMTRAGAAAGNTVELTAILTDVEGVYSAFYFIYGSNPVVTGDGELSENGDEIGVIVNGDCTITVDPVTGKTKALTTPSR